MGECVYVVVLYSLVDGEIVNGICNCVIIIRGWGDYEWYTWLCYIYLWWGDCKWYARVWYKMDQRFFYFRGFLVVHEIHFIWYILSTLSLTVYHVSCTNTFTWLCALMLRIKLLLYHVFIYLFSLCFIIFIICLLDLVLSQHHDHDRRTTFWVDLLAFDTH